MGYKLIPIDEFSEYQNHEDCEAFKEKWQQDVELMLKKDKWRLHEAINLISGFRSDRPCFTDDPTGEEQPHYYCRPEQTWDRNKAEGKYWKARKRVREGVTYNEFSVEPDQSDNSKPEELEEEKIAQERAEIRERLDPNQKKLITSVLFKTSYYPKELHYLVVVKEFLGWANEDFDLHDVFKVKIPKEKRPWKRREFANRREANLCAMIGVLADPSFDVSKADGTVMVRKLFEAAYSNPHLLNNQKIYDEDTFRKLFSEIMKSLAPKK